MSLVKYRRLELPALRKLAKGAPCMVARIMATGWQHDSETVVWAHSNLAQHGKGARRKADDCFGFFACWRCHANIDQGNKLDRETRRHIQHLAMAATRRYLIEHGLIVGASLPTALDDGIWMAGWVAGTTRVA